MQTHVIREPTSVKHLKSVRLMDLVVGGIFRSTVENVSCKKRAFTRTHVIIVRSFDFV